MRLGLALLLLAALASACGAGSDRYEARGRVETVDAAARQIRINHEEIKGFMPAMTMNFDVAREVPLEGVAPGDAIRFTLERTGSSLRIVRIAKEGAAGTVGTMSAEEDVAPLRAERAPDIRLVDQEGRPFDLADLRGRAVLLDFFYTGCTGPCPILTASHVRLQRRLPPDLRPKVRFVSVSLDPANDTPEKLRRYAREQGADLAAWSFLTGEPARVDQVMRAYHVGRVKLPDRTLNHTIVTYLIDPKGFIRRHYLGLEVDGDRLLADLEEAAS
jgi:protein SCO1/2